MANKSIEGKVFRVVLAAATAGSLLGCARSNSKQTEEVSTPVSPKLLPCESGEFYPEEGQLPQEATYNLEIPVIHGCGFELYIDEYRDIYLLVYADKIEFIIFENKIGTYAVRTLPLPEQDQSVEFSWDDIFGKVTLLNGYYNVTYTAPESHPPAIPAPVPTSIPWPDGWVNP